MNNNFTKEELESILNYCDVYSEFGASWTYKCIKPLMDKIQSMIDNYCEHLNTSTINPGDTVKICHQCEAVLSPGR